MNKNNSSNENVYGQTFSSYSQKEFEDFSLFFERRLIRNGICPDELFKGKRCLDAGCGGGRGSWLMLKYGAEEVIGVDQSLTNTESFIERIKKTDKHSRFRSINVDLEELELNERFDFIWFSGVIQHTVYPSIALKKVYEHLEINGLTFFYAYGRDGLYWQLVDLARHAFAQINDIEMLDLLRGHSLENRYIAEYMDDWKVPFIRAYTNLQMRDALNTCGVSPLIKLDWGENYDTCLRPKIFPKEKRLWGEGDLRYLGIKTNQSNGEVSKELDDKECIISLKNDSYHPVIQLTQSLLESKKTLEKKVLFMATVQRELRDMMNQDEPFDIPRFEKKIQSF